MIVGVVAVVAIVVVVCRGGCGCSKRGVPAVRLLNTRQLSECLASISARLSNTPV